MAVTTRRVAEQHDDWVTLTDPEPPWFSLPVLKRVFPNGLDRTPPELRAEHKARWYGGDGIPPGRSTEGRADYLNWLLREALAWGGPYLTGSSLPDELSQGVTRHDVTIVPGGVYQPELAAPVGLFDDPPGPEAEPTRPRVLVFVLPSGVNPLDRPHGDSWPATWVQRAALSCRHHEVPLALVTDGDHLTLVHAAQDTATGWGTWRASEFATEPVLFDSFRSMLHARRFVAVANADTPEALLDESVGSQAEITDQLGFQVRRATELLVNAISRADHDREGMLLVGIEPHQVYEAAVTVMMRLVFLLVAEENGLLPVDNPHYQQLYAIRTLRESLEHERFENPEALETRTTAWHRLLATSRAVHRGVHHDELTVSAYGGELFDPDRYAFLEGRAHADGTIADTGTPIPVTDLDVLAILDALLVLRFAASGGVTDTRRLSYRQVDVEQIGHIYERLLDHDAVRAHTVVLGLKGKPGEEPEVDLPTLEAKQLDGEKALISYLTDKEGKKGGCYVGTANQVTRLLGQPIDGHLRASLLQACQGEQALARRVEPFAHLVRLDLRDRPLVFLTDAVYVTETGSRRDSGTAYTTRELADEVAEHALAPLAYSPGPQDTPDTNQWRIKRSAEILALKVCDPAVGSGAILVAACRYLADRLIEAWRAEDDPRSAETATAADDPNRLEVKVQARRLVAEHCCYGVDRNPMAVEMAKLSMWLTTVAKDRPFTFLDHALKSGDSLLGMWSLDQLRYLHYDVTAGRQRTVPIADWNAGGDALFAVEQLVDEALSLRREVQAIDTQRPSDIERKQQLHAESEARLAVLSTIADVVAGAAISTAGERDPVAALTSRLDADAEVIGRVVAALGTPDQADALQAAEARARKRLDGGRPDGAPSRRPLHWPIAFPEVFSRTDPGFDAMVGNPPFIGGQLITPAMGDGYRMHLVEWWADGRKGSSDLVAYFFLAASKLCRYLGFLATNTVAQGETSDVGLGQMIDRGWTIFRAESSVTWPGDSTLEIAKVWASALNWSSESELDGRSVSAIDEMLYPESKSGWRKARLKANEGLAYQGVTLLGTGFLMPPSDAQNLIQEDQRYSDVLFPYLGGEDLNQSPTQESPRWVINFFDWPEEKARKYPACFQRVEELVKPERQKHLAKKYGISQRRGTLWWLYSADSAALTRAIGDRRRVLAIARVGKAVRPLFVPTGQVFNEKIVVLVFDDDFHFGVYSSEFHYRWAVRHSSTLGGSTINYSPTDVFDTFARPDHSDPVAEAGQSLDDFRKALMARRGLGLTDLYNLFSDSGLTNDKEVVRLRELHVALDYAVQAAYGWDVELDHGFHEVRGQGTRFTISPTASDRVLELLLELNRSRFEVEVAAGLQRPLGGRHGKRRGATVVGQGSLLGEER